MQYSKGKLPQNSVRNHEEAYCMGSISFSVMSLCIILNWSSSNPKLFPGVFTIEDVQIYSHAADICQ